MLKILLEIKRSERPLDDKLLGFITKNSYFFVANSCFLSGYEYYKSTGGKDQKIIKFIM